MSCTACQSKSCRKEARDCFGVQPPSLEAYAEGPARRSAIAASRLVDDGRAGTLDRLEEVIEYCHTMGYRRVGVAYCFGMPEHAALLEKRLKAAGLRPILVQCTVGGVRERDIDPRKSTETVSCNPAGQALALKKLGAEFVIELGLCMRHDVILHQTLEVPFTTFLVKDRVHGHQPARALGSAVDPLARLLAEADSSPREIPADLLRAWLDRPAPSAPIVLDVRSSGEHAEGRVPGSLSAPLGSLPRVFRELLPDRGRRIVCVAEGSTQATLAVAFLYDRGYGEAYQLAGGFRGWTEQGNPVESSHPKNRAGEGPDAGREEGAAQATPTVRVGEQDRRAPSSPHECASA